jgi:hypothetical protein
MERKIIGFRRDEAGDWIADLDCGHSLHLRHDPPWQLRAWILSEAERRKRIGSVIECAKCDEASGP